MKEYGIPQGFNIFDDAEDGKYKTHKKLDPYSVLDKLTESLKKLINESEAEVDNYEKWLLGESVNTDKELDSVLEDLKQTVLNESFDLQEEDEIVDVEPGEDIEELPEEGEAEDIEGEEGLEDIEDLEDIEGKDEECLDCEEDLEGEDLEEDLDFLTEDMESLEAEILVESLLLETEEEIKADKLIEGILNEVEADMLVESIINDVDAEMLVESVIEDAQATRLVESVIGEEIKGTPITEDIDDIDISEGLDFILEEDDIEDVEGEEEEDVLPEDIEEEGEEDIEDTEDVDGEDVEKEGEECAKNVEEGDGEEDEEIEEAIKIAESLIQELGLLNEQDEEDEEIGEIDVTIPTTEEE